MEVLVWTKIIVWKNAIYVKINMFVVLDS